MTTLEEGLQRRKLSRADSYSVEFYDREDIYFREFPYRIQVNFKILSDNYFCSKIIFRLLWLGLTTIRTRGLKMKLKN